MDMFALDRELLRRGPVLDCPAGAASFAAEAHAMGLDVTASDVLYGLTEPELRERAEADIRHVHEKLDDAGRLYTWQYYRDKADLMAFRKKASDYFIADYREGKRDGRYVEAALPRLPFEDGRFSLVLSSHLLFLYGDMLDLDFHMASVGELVRVSSREARIYPINGLNAKPYPHLDKVLESLQGQGICAEIVETPFEFQLGSNRMLRLTKIENGGSYGTGRKRR